MGRPEWILVFVVLSVGLVGVVAPAGAGAENATLSQGDVGPTDPARDAISNAESAGERGAILSAVRRPAVQQDRFQVSTQQEFERSTFRVLVHADGDARWQYRFERPVESDDERAAFQRYAERFRTQETDFYRDFRNRSAALTAAASAETGRTMETLNVTRDAGIEQTPTQEVGYVELAFEWTNFARVEGNSVVVGDVFTGGLYLGASQSLILVADDGVSFDSAEPTGAPSNGTLAESRSVTWTGEEDFAHRHPRAIFQIQRPSGGSTDGASMLWLLGGGIIGLVLVTVLVVARYGGLPRGDGRDASGAVTASSADQSVGDAASEPGDSEAGDDETATSPSAEPITDDQRVTELLEDGGGRMKQTAIVEETEWSKSKVSMLLSEMEDEGHIKKIQVGRENIIALAGHEPEAASSPFDDE